MNRASVPRLAMTGEVDEGGRAYLGPVVAYAMLCGADNKKSTDCIRGLPNKK